MTTSSTGLVSPVGGSLVNLIVPAEVQAELRARANRLPSIQLSERAVYDLELLATGGFSPLNRFMSRSDFERVVGEMRLATGQLSPIPVVLPVDRTAAVHLDQDVALRDAHNELLGIMTVDEAYEWDRGATAQQVLGTRDVRHPLVAEMQRWGDVNLSGPLQILALPPRHDFRDIRLTPAETRARLAALGAANVVAFQTRNPLHRAHEELTKRAADAVAGTLLLHPVVGMTKPGDVDHYTRVRTYKVLVERYYERGRVLLALLPLAMRMAGPREAVWHALIRRNYGASHFIVGRDHASPGLDSAGKPFYGAYDAQELVGRFQEELGIGMLPFGEMMYLPDEDRYEEISRIPANARTASISGTQVRDDFLNVGEKLPGLVHPPRGRPRSSRIRTRRATARACACGSPGSAAPASPPPPRSSPCCCSSAAGRSPCWTVTWYAPIYPRAWGSARRTATPIFGVSDSSPRRSCGTGAWPCARR